MLLKCEKTTINSKDTYTIIITDKNGKQFITELINYDWYDFVIVTGKILLDEYDIENDDEKFSEFSRNEVARMIDFLPVENWKKLLNNIHTSLATIGYGIYKVNTEF